MPTRRTPWVGAIGGLLAGVPLGIALTGFLPDGFGWLMAGLVVVVTVLLYLAANQAVKTSADPAASTPGNYVRCGLIGMNAGLNASLAWTVDGALFGAFGDVVAIVLGLIVLGTVVPGLSRKDIYQGILGWSNLLLPMSWPVVGLGLAFWLIGLLGHLLGYRAARSTFFQIVAMKSDWKTGTFFTRGGVIANLNPIDTAFNMGTFAFVDAKPGQTTVEVPEWHVEHEAGHTLNLAAFGSVFHLIGALDENVLGGRERAFSERLAESNDPATTLSSVLIPMWAP